MQGESGIQNTLVFSERINFKENFNRLNMATQLTSNKVRTACLRCHNAGFQDIVLEPENISSKDIEENIIESPEAGGIIRWSCRRMPSLTFARKVVAEIIGTFFMVFAGFGSMIIDKKTDGAITHLGVSLVWGMVVMILIYTIGHISGAHLNPAVTVAFAVVRRFPCTHVPAYIGAQVFASISASFVLRLMSGEVADMAATISPGSYIQTFVLDVLITFFLMFVVSAVATDTRGIGELAGLAIGTAVAVISLVAGPTGASINPALNLGSAVPGNKYTGIWIHMISPVVGAIMAAVSYNMIRLTDKPVQEISKSESFIRRQRSSR